MSDSADRRARRKLLAEAYNNLPSRETLQAAVELERARMQRATQNAQLALQYGSLAVAVLSQLPRDNEDNKPLFAGARTALDGVLKHVEGELDRLKNEDAQHEESDDEVDEGPDV